ncbi:mevalonate kinase family protein [Sinomicrobium weinanense]|uniref:Galactokinase n=1 Tax=Sinomicrobium weinanense TaxID=2842200 RepID=A0A926JPQ3_9FLAO|nr:galactokinase family protein [Sinomicrobium weinanense]MBC9795048.1 galactokinase [Sinomicrobium weinanense]MBU3123823.1 galactokinase [Sinomicrobium weinanense]
MNDLTKKENIFSVAPGRVCLFGDHQDYLELPVIACAIDRFITLKAIPNDQKIFNLFLPDLDDKRNIALDVSSHELTYRDYLVSSLKVLHRYGCKPDRGYDIEIRGDVPMNAGISSSTAVVVAWINFLATAFGTDEEMTPSLLSQIAYEAEVLEHGEPGGKMDQYSIGVGNVVYIETGDDFSCSIIGDSLEGLIVAESGIPKETIGTLSRLKNNALEAVALIKDKRNDFVLEDTIPEDIPQYLDILPDALHPFFEAAVKNLACTRQALELLKEKKPDMKRLGAFMNEHHNILRDLLHITVPRIDDMVEAALQAGAFGAKIVGSGGGGSIVVIAPGKEKEVIDALKKAGARDAYKVSVDQGARIVNSVLKPSSKL